MTWVVVQTRHGQEQTAYDNLVAQGFDAYLPRISELVVRRGRRVESVRPLFPRYEFVRDTGESLRSLMGTRGVSSVLMDGDRFGHVSDLDVHKLRLRETSRGLVVLPRFSDGQPVISMRGLMEGQMGLYDGMVGGDRVRVLFGMMGRRVPVVLLESQVAAA